MRKRLFSMVILGSFLFSSSVSATGSNTGAGSKKDELSSTINIIKNKAKQKDEDAKLEDSIKKLESEVIELKEYRIKNSQLANSLSNLGVAQGLSIKEIDFASSVPVTYFGDSLVAGSISTFQTLFKNSNGLGVGSMQIAPEGQQRLNDLINRGLVAKYVVIVLGTNRGLSEAEVDVMVQSLGDREIFFVNTISHVNHRVEVANQIKIAARKYKNVHEVDYLSNYNVGYLGSDMIHHTSLGVVAMVQLIAKTMYGTYYK